MRSAGIDIGSRTVKIVVLEGRTLVHHAICYNSHDPIEVARTLLAECSFDRLTATGYGRHLISKTVSCDVITEIRAAAQGASFLVPGARTVIDIGGQDIKVIALTDKGAVRKFEMNDKCAAGTGRFLEIMAAALSLSMSEFVIQAASAAQAVKVSSMCTVFAESEIVSQVARGASRDGLALGIHQSIAQRVAALLSRIPVEDHVVLCGGVARNPTLVRELGTTLGLTIIAPDLAQFVPAIGCALLSGETSSPI